MRFDARKYSTSEQALIRRLAVQRVFDGERSCDITKAYGLSDKVIFKWIRKAKKEGLDSLAPLPRSGRARTLKKEEEQEVKSWIVAKDPRQHRFDFCLWTRKIVADLIENRYGVILSVNSVGRLLHRQGLMPQKPLRRAYERDEAAVKEWEAKEYPKIKRLAKKQGAEIFWLDEASIRSDDLLLRTWRLKGQTPMVQTSGQRQSISAISALSNKGGFWYHVYTGRFNSEKFIECLKRFIRHRKRPVILIMDRHPVHKAKKVREYIEAKKNKLRIFLLPLYAPDLNPHELVWNQMKPLGTPKNH